MSNAVSSMQLPTLSNLFEQKKNELKQFAGNLQIDDVKKDDRFATTVKRIKQQLSLTQVTIGEPKITHHNQTTKNVPPNFQNPWGGPQEVFIITVSFPFAGSTELLSYMPTDVPITMGRVYQTYGSSIDVEVTLTKLDKTQALAEAKDDMNTTIAVAEGNNSHVEAWAKTFEPLIDTTLTQRRKELIDLYS